MAFEKQVWEIAQPRWISIQPETYRSIPQWTLSPGEKWAQNYLELLALNAKSTRKDLFVIDPGVATKVDGLEHELESRKDSHDAVDKLFLQSRIAYAKSVAFLTNTIGDLLPDDRKRYWAERADNLSRQWKSINIGEGQTNLNAFTLHKNWSVDFSIEVTIWCAEAEAPKASAKLSGQGQLVCWACRRLGYSTPGAQLMEATLDALSILSLSPYDRLARRSEGPGKSRFAAVLSGLRAELAVDGLEPRTADRCVELGRELQSIDDLERQGRLSEMQSRCAALWRRITEEPQTSVAK